MRSFGLFCFIVFLHFFDSLEIFFELFIEVYSCFYILLFEWLFFFFAHCFPNIWKNFHDLWIVELRVLFLYCFFLLFKECEEGWTLFLFFRFRLWFLSFFFDMFANTLQSCNSLSKWKYFFWIFSWRLLPSFILLQKQ